MSSDTSDGGSVVAPIAIDGPAASGKSSLGSALARRYGLTLFDTGVTYRAFTLVALERGVPADNAEACARLARELDVRVEGNDETRIWVDGVELTGRLREPAVERAVSSYSAIPQVREVMVELQRRVAAAQPSVVVGRDIGTVVLPGAPVKFFLTASDEARAQRRSQQARDWGQVQDAPQASSDIRGRDSIDSSRATGPTRAAEDAVVIDTTDLAPAEVLKRAIEVIACANG